MLETNNLKSNFVKRIRRHLSEISKLIDSYEKISQSTMEESGQLAVSFLNDRLYLNGAKIIDKKASLQIAIFKILLEKHILGNIYSTTTGMNTSQISAKLVRDGSKNCAFTLIEPERQVWQAIYLLKKRVGKEFGKETGENFIISSQTSGQYKLNEKIVLICSENV